MNLTFRYIDDVLSMNNPNLANLVLLIYEMNSRWRKQQKQLPLSHFLAFTSNLTPNWDQWSVPTKLYDKSDDINFDIIHFPHLDSNIPNAPAYGVYISQFIGFSRASSLYVDFLQRHRVLIPNLLNQGFLKNRLFFLSFKMFFGRYQHLDEKYSVSCVHMRKDGIGN